MTLLPGGKTILQIITILILVAIILCCVIRILNKKGGWCEVWLGIGDFICLLFALCS